MDNIATKPIPVDPEGAGEPVLRRDRERGGSRGVGLVWRTCLTLLFFFTVIAASHEYGHLIAARALGVETSVFSVGIGPKLAVWRHNGMDYVLSALPLGAYVDFPSEKGSTALTGSSFDKSAPPIRFLIALAGPLTNVLLVWVAFFIYRAIGAPQRGTAISDVDPGSPADLAGIRPGDSVFSVNGREVSTWSDLSREIKDAPSSTLVVGLRCGSSTRTATIETRDVAERDGLTNTMYTKRYLGITPSAKRKTLPFSLPKSAAYANAEFRGLMSHLFINIRDAFRGRLKAEEALGSPILLVQLVTAFIRQGRSPYVLFPVLNLSVALVNFLPVPMLDGGHMAFAVVQALFPVQLTKTASHWLTAVGVGFVISVFVFAIKADVKRLARAKKEDKGRPAIEISGLTI